MRILSLIVVAMSASAFGVNFGSVQPTGDSITGGWEETGHGGYRGPLIDSLRTSGHQITVVGQMTNDSWNLPLEDRNHEGHNGWSFGMIAANLPAWLTANQPDTILLMAGTNNTTDWNKPNVTRANVSNLFDIVFAYRPDARLFVANIPDANPNFASWHVEHGIHADNVNASVLAEVAEHRALGRQAYYVDVRSVIDPLVDIRDTVHPTTFGFQKMAGQWHGAMNAVPEPGSLAVLAVGLLALRRRTKVG